MFSVGKRTLPTTTYAKGVVLLLCIMRAESTVGDSTVSTCQLYYASEPVTITAETREHTVITVRQPSKGDDFGRIQEKSVKGSFLGKRINRTRFRSTDKSNRRTHSAGIVKPFFLFPTMTVD